MSSVPRSSPATVENVVASNAIKLIQEALDKKPVSRYELVEAYHAITKALADELVSHLPALDQKALTAIMWGVNTVRVTSTDCGCY